MNIEVNKPDDTEPNYFWWVTYKSIWTLKEAANLYLGFDPSKGGTFYQINELLETHKNGLVLTDSETVWDVQELKRKFRTYNESELTPSAKRIASISDPCIEFEDIYDKNDESKICLKYFIEGKIKSGEIQPAPSRENSDETYFVPTDIITLFQKYFINTPNEKLLLELGLFKHNQFRSGSKKSLTQENRNIIEKVYLEYRASLNGKSSNAVQDRDELRKLCSDYQITDQLIQDLRKKYLSDTETKSGRRPKK